MACVLGRSNFMKMFSQNCHYISHQFKVFYKHVFRWSCVFCFVFKSPKTFFCIYFCLMVNSLDEASFSQWFYELQSCSNPQTSFPLGIVKLETGSNLTDSTNAIIRQPAPGADHFCTCCSPTWAQLKLTPDHRCQNQFLDNTWLQNWLLQSNKCTESWKFRSVYLHFICVATEKPVEKNSWDSFSEKELCEEIALKGNPSFSVIPDGEIIHKYYTEKTGCYF